MRTLFVIFFLALSTIAAAQSGVNRSRVNANEGRLADSTAVALDDKRVATYSDEPATMEASPGTAQSEKKHSAGAMKQEPKRAPSVVLSQKSSWFRLFDAGSVLKSDRDHDGHYSEFEIRFDADSLSGNAMVYAKIYMRRVGDTGDWEHIHTTDDFWIYGQSGTDDYYVTTTLDSGFPTGDYDVLIDLYESGYSGIVATLTAYDDSSLASLPLEERGLDVAYDLPGYTIRDVSTTLLIDDDRDGYYSKFRIRFDPDTDFGSAMVYAIVYVRPQGGDWIKEHESKDFVVDSSGTTDAYSFTADWLSGYPTAKYDVQLDLHDAATGLLVASAGSDRPEFSRIPLEDLERDRFVAPPPPPSTGSVTIVTTYEEGGGSLSVWIALALTSLWVARSIASRRRQRRAILLLAASRR